MITFVYMVVVLPPNCKNRNDRNGPCSHSLFASVCQLNLSHSVITARFLLLCPHPFTLSDRACTTRGRVDRMDHWSPSPHRYATWRRNSLGLWVTNPTAYSPPSSRSGSPTPSELDASRHIFPNENSPLDAEIYTRLNTPSNSSPCKPSEAPPPCQDEDSRIASPPPFNRYTGVRGSVYDPHGSVPFHDPLDMDDVEAPVAITASQSKRPIVTPANPDPPFESSTLPVHVDL
jgi:hypothetical protein